MALKGQEISKEEGRRIEKALQAAKGDEELYRRIQMVHLRATHGMMQPVIAKACGVSLSPVNRAHMAWLAEGMDSFKVEPRGGRIRENMTLAAEKAFLKGSPTRLEPENWSVSRTSTKPMRKSLGERPARPQSTAFGIVIAGANCCHARTIRAAISRRSSV